MTNIQVRGKKMNKLIKIGALALTIASLSACSSMNRSTIGAYSGGATGVAACVAAGNTDPYVTGLCALSGGFLGAELMYNSDYDVHNAVFVDHLNTAPAYGSSYTNWFNAKTGNSGIIHITKSYMEGPFKCKEYDATIDITNNWPLVGIGGVNREIVFGTACQTPDGQWIEKP